MAESPTQNTSTFKSVAIANGESLSGAINCEGEIAALLYIPASFEGGYVTFEIAEELAGTYKPLRTAEGDYVIYNATSDCWIKLNPADFVGVQFLKVRSTDVAGAAAAQTGAATLRLGTV